MNSIRRSLLRLGRAVAASVRKSTTLRSLLAQVRVARSDHYRRARLVATGCLLILGMNPTLFAQAPVDRGSLHFRTMGWGVAPDDLFYSVGGKDIGVKIFDAGRSGFQDYPKRGEISFYRIVEKEDGTEEHVIVAKGDLRGGGPTPLLIMTKSKADPDKLDMTVIADDLTAFPERTCRFVNFTPIEIKVTVGRKAATIQPGDIRLVDTNLETDDRTRYVTTSVTVKDQKLMLSYNNWVFRPGQRVMVFIAVSKDGKPRVIRLVDAVGPLTSF